MDANNPKKLKKILYVEDNFESRILVRRILSRDYIILEADNPLDGIALALDARPDLVLLDINLPDMSGREVATRLRDALPGVPLVALTADITSGARERAIVAGCVGFMSKPIDVDTFPDEVLEYLNGKREDIEEVEEHAKKYQAELVEHLEIKIGELTKIAEQNEFLNQQNKHVIAAMKRHQRLFEAGASVGHTLTSILDLDQLLQTTVDIICQEFGFYYAGIFLREDNNIATLKAGYGERGAAMLAESCSFNVNNETIIGTVILSQTGKVIADISDEKNYQANPHLHSTRSEMALPLIAKDSALGALTVQSEKVNDFDEADIAALQGMADQIAVAIRNADLLHDLESANQQLLRTKTFEAIATATGEAIHWVGNKAAPIPGSAERVQEDLLNFLAIFKTLLDMPPDQRDAHPFAEVANATFSLLTAEKHNLNENIAALNKMPASQLPLIVDIESTLEDLGIVKQSAETILNIKEDLIGPGRLPESSSFDLPTLFAVTITGMGLPAGVVTTDFPDELPEAWGDKRQVGRVFINLIKNAWEALGKGEQAKIHVSARPAEEQGYVEVRIRDNGPGIPKEIQDKIWVSFFTTKGSHGGTGLGLSACMEIITQSGGKIWLESEVGEGATFITLLPTEKK